MRNSLYICYLFLAVLCGPGDVTTQLCTVQSQKTESSPKTTDEWTTVDLAPMRISGEKGKYHSLHLSVSYGFLGRAPQKPAFVDFELKSVVKARKLKIDLYVVFVVDGETIFLSSNRSAIKNPVRGRRWVGERLVFRMPYDTLLKITKAKKFAIKMDAVTFELGEPQVEALRDFARRIESGNE